MAELSVAMIIQAYAPHVGGAERQLQALLPRLRERGIEARVFTRAMQGAPEHERIDGTQVHRVPVPPWTPKAAASITFTTRVLRELASWRPNVIHAHELLSPTTTALLARGLLGVPVVSKVLRGGELGDVAKLQRSVNGRMRLRAIAKYVDAFAVISSEIDAELAAQGVGEERRHAIPNGVDASKYAQLGIEARRIGRSERGIGQSTPLVLFAGRLVPEKRVDVLLDAWEIVVGQIPDATLWIAGDGPSRPCLRDRSGTNVEFLGWVEQVDPLLALADVFVLPSDTEGLSNALLEAMAAQMGVVATNVGAAQDLLGEGSRGIVVPPRDPDALASALIRLLSRPSIRAEMGRSARSFVAAEYSLDTTADRLARLYRTLASRGGGSA